MFRRPITAMECVTAIPLVLLILSPESAKANDEINIIESVAIGEQVWMKRNMDVTTFRNGDPISRLDIPSAWKDAGRSKIPAYAIYDNAAEPLADWGLLYNFAAITDPRGICPKGWRVPNNSDWQDLENFLGGGVKAAGALKASFGWPGAFSGTNDTGFAALPAGWRTQDGIYYLAGRIAYFWTSDLSNDGTVVSHMLFDVERPIFRIGYDRGMGQSLRCIAE